jgi:hypothetical protein
MVTQNKYSKYTGMYHGGFEKYGVEITKLLLKYPILNHIWYVYGEEFITDRTLIGNDSQLLDPWTRPFKQEFIDESVLEKLPTTHIKIKTTVEGKIYMCNVFVEKLKSVDIECGLCYGLYSCIECGLTKRKKIYYP